MSEVRLSAATRTEFGKGASRRVRRAGLVPAVVYGHGEDPKHVALPARDFAAAIRNGGSNVLLTLEIEGGEQLAIPKSIQRHPIKNYFEHVDLLTVRRGEKVTVDVPITIVGDVAPGGLLNQENTSVSVEAEATNIPTEFEVSIEGLAIGSQITAADVELPTGSSLVTDGEILILAIAEAPTEAELEAEVAEAAEELGIVEDAPEDESGESEGESGDGAEGGDSDEKSE
ncbi:50S ribosomal protein L25/general stress protein Ctc [Jatrophihabitans fulvus]